ncbi:MAG: DUF4446 family protein [Sporomusaceae bacterium]|nr:DUF4446 family protein [Sporomusaceae bacterium]
MEFMQYITDLIMGNLGTMILGLTVCLFLALLIFISINIKLSRLNKRYRKLMSGAEGANIEQLLMQHIEELRTGMKTIAAVEQECKSIREDSRTNLKKVGMVRFNAFEDTGSDLSFAIAILDEKNNGFVLSNIFGRNEARVYAKPIEAGLSTYFLSDEEKEALQRAQKN